MRRAGVDQAEFCTNYLRLGGVTAYANSPDGGVLAAGCMGLWRSDADHGYVHAAN